MLKGSYMIYADFNGSAIPHEAVKAYLSTRFEKGYFANPNAIHGHGQKILAGMSKCRRTCAKVLGADTNQIIFNSGASEGISAVFASLLHDKNQKRKTIVISSIEHSAVVNASKFYQSQDYEVIVIPVNSDGVVKISELEQVLKKKAQDIALVSIMAANNETGVIQPYQEISKLCQKYQVQYFSDTTQFIGKHDFNFQESGMDYAVLSGHKVGALIGSGILLVKNPEKLRPHIFGGGQENGCRGGTQNYIGIETLAIALDAFEKEKNKMGLCLERRLNFEKKLKEKFKNIVIIGEQAPRLASTTLVAYPGIHGQGVQIELESQDIFVTTSSACSDNEPTTSKVLKAMNVTDDIGRGVVRISLCLGQNPDAYDRIYSALENAYNKLAKIKNY